MSNALDDLIAKVEAGEDVCFADVECCFIRADTTQYPVAVDYAILAYRGSLDAAKALHEAALPGWGWTITNDGFAQLDMDWQDDTREPEYDEVVKEARSDTPARAWLIAILRAMKEGKDA